VLTAIPLPDTEMWIRCRRNKLITLQWASCWIYSNDEMTEI